MQETMNAINDVMNTCRDALEQFSDDHERSTLILNIVFNVARLAGEEGVSQQRITHEAFRALAIGYQCGAGRRSLKDPIH